MMFRFSLFLHRFARLPRRLRPARGVRGFFVLAVFAAGLLFSAACAPRETEVERGNRAQILHRGTGPEIATLDPHLATGTGEFNVLSAFLEGLVAEHPETLEPVPDGVAEKWEVSADALTYTFTLRGDARWSNGLPVTAQDFVASYRRILTPALGADCAPLLYVIRNAEAWHRGRVADFAAVGLAAPDERTLRITLEHPAPRFLSMLTHTAFMPVHAPSIGRHGAVEGRGTAWAVPGRFVGNGPFNLAEWRPGQKIRAVKSPTYWDAGRVRLREIHFHFIESREVEERAFRTGQLHLTEALPPGKIEVHRARTPSPLRIDPYLGTEFYRINTARPFLNDQRVRRALALAVDRAAITGKILRGGQRPARAFTPPGTGGYVSAAWVPDDPEAARRLLAEAGYPGGRGAPPVELLFNTSESHRAVAEAVQEMWRRELGLEVRLVNQENKVAQAARRGGRYELVRSAWIADFIDPVSFLGIWTAGSGNNHTGWSDPAYDQALFQAARTGEPAVRAALLQRAEAILLDAAPCIPLYHYTHVFLIHPAVKNWHPTLLDHHPYKHVWLGP
ncbi:MAG: peptide ABC transporter substrate-binding protein [Opitutaceae bacterium]|jgi:oligopeptide transport system substrate-binding protein|nr:peptide ABC transporter substrate-binding protein [Opitutaceae bacterium]